MSPSYLNLLPVAIALHEARSVSRAALALGLSQPATSAALAKLRRVFDDPLFVKTSRGMQATPRAEALVGKARDALQAIEHERVSGVGWNPQSSRQPFNFALSDAGEMVFLPRLVQRLRRAAPNAPVNSLSLPLTALEAGAVDLAIGYFPELSSKAYQHQRLFNHTFASLLRTSHSIRGRTLSTRQFSTLDHADVRIRRRKGG